MDAESKTPWVISLWRNLETEELLYLIDSADALFPNEDLVELMGDMIEHRAANRIVWLTYRPDPSEGEELWHRALRDFQARDTEKAPASPEKSATLEVQQQTS